MKKILLSCLALMFLGTATVQAQGFLDKLDRALDKVTKASNSAEKAASAAGKVKNSGNSLLQKSNNEVTGDLNKTTINIVGTDMATLRKLNAAIETCDIVTDAKLKYSSKKSSIEVSHNGSTDELLEAILKKETGIFTDKNIEDLKDGAIQVNLGPQK
ncbi:hypothetical protein HMPREF0765_3165 [Sphingobacterium spiritivorum ATCC 33300]|uniref:Auto-transporter adhesin head GIN domain-containing protein n=1 Tax=Sphingobacterium spiritivorum ATCC 33300 TaxID=525372 RepID=C2G0Q9_SPHSI|nr:hypothetical protein [Sphingobacterium spiritivorum]EEI91139.1 hypothetical protein HMPREF0765_3165 [Sphingobacterium spiritivorum ATCC 33300]QQS97537.1 hypothetical protein I6J03_07460 [Sphingobacterium spiritivorum]